MSKLFHSWGRPLPEAMRSRVLTAWGARAIYTHQVVDLVWDRQNWGVPSAKDPEKYSDEEQLCLKRLSDWINKTGLPFLHKQAESLGIDEERVVAMNDGRFHIEASPQRSFGYLYILAWEASDGTL